MPLQLIVDVEDFPVLAPVAKVSLALDGEMLCFCVEPPPHAFETFPWKTFHAFKAARNRPWVQETVSNCKQALRVSADGPVMLGFDGRALRALATVAGWFVQRGFARRDESFF